MLEACKKSKDLGRVLWLMPFWMNMWAKFCASHLEEFNLGSTKDF